MISAKGCRRRRGRRGARDRSALNSFETTESALAVPRPEVTDLLVHVAQGDAAARDRLFTLVYAEMRLLAASQVRQAKQIVSQSRLLLDRIRTQAETAAIAAFVTHEGMRTAIAAADAEVRAATLALNGVQKEAQAGQRTTLDVLNSQQDLTAARSRQILSQRDRVIASYTLLSAIGKLDVRTLGLNTPDYLPEVHYHQVRDAWHGLRTPSGQ